MFVEAVSEIWKQDGPSAGGLENRVPRRIFGRKKDGTA
jgi:hypothetical protein